MPLPETIRTFNDVRQFVQTVMLEERVSFHPDTAFDEYVDSASGQPTYSPDECRARDALLDGCFIVAGHFVHDIALDVAHGGTGVPSSTDTD